MSAPPNEVSPELPLVAPTDVPPELPHAAPTEFVFPDLPLIGPIDGGGSDVPRTMELGARLIFEFDKLNHEFSLFGAVLWIGFVLAIAWAVAWGGPASVRTAWRLGLDPRRRLGLLASGLRVVGLLIGIGGLLRPIIAHAPFIAVSVVIVALALAGLIAPMQLRNLASGLSLATRSRLREGDLVTIGPLEGTVRDIGLLRVSLRTVDGGVTHVPAADFEREAVTVGSRRAAVPIEAKVIAGPEFDDRARERLRRDLWLSPYRRAGTEPRVSVDAETYLVEVRIDTWAATSTVEVERHIRALLLDATQGRATELIVAEEVGA